MRILSSLAALAVIVPLTACGNDSSTGNDTDKTPLRPTSPFAGNEPSSPTLPENTPEAIAAADGTMTATVNGQSLTWYITSQELAGHLTSQSDWTGGGPTTIVTLFGHVSASAMIAKGSLVIAFTIIDTGNAVSVDAPEIDYLVDGVPTRYSSDTGGKATVKVTRAETTGDVLTLSGTFSGTLKFKSMNGAQPEPGKDTLAIDDGTFKATVHKLRQN